jgi:hypothetical protein
VARKFLRFLRALEEDREFRYAVAGYLGLSETLKRLDTFEESLRKLWEEVKSLRENEEKYGNKSRRSKRRRTTSVPR